MEIFKVQESWPMKMFDPFTVNLFSCFQIRRESEEQDLIFVQASRSVD